MSEQRIELEIRRFLKHECRRQRAYLWGKYRVFTPYLVKKIFGDGLQVIYFQSIDDRPYWWVVRIDSKTELDNDFDYESILDVIEEECGRPDEGDNTWKYPMISWAGGHWGLIKNFKPQPINP
jgi:hypothetical protein